MGDTESFLILLQQQNERIAAQEAERNPIESDLDPIREQRDQARREKYGQLRAREHPGKRRTHVTSVFGYTDLSS